MSLWTRILLGVSLTLNLFVIGAIIGVLILREQNLAGSAGHDPVMGAADGLTPAHRDAYRAMMVQTLVSVRPTLRDARIARRQAMMQIVAEPFDRAAADASLARAREDDAAARGRVEDAVLDFAVTLPPQERSVLVRGLARAALARWLAAHPGRRPPTPRDP